VLRAPRFHDTQYRPHRGRRRALHASLCQFCRLHRLSRGADNGPVPIPAGSGTGRAAQLPHSEEIRFAAASSDFAFNFEESRLPLRADRQMAFGLPARVRAVTKRL
jgi:hypothetical protein